MLWQYQVQDGWTLNKTKKLGDNLFKRYGFLSKKNEKLRGLYSDWHSNNCRGCYCPEEVQYRSVYSKKNNDYSYCWCTLYKLDQKSVGIADATGVPDWT